MDILEGVYMYMSTWHQGNDSVSWGFWRGEVGI